MSEFSYRLPDSEKLFKGLLTSLKLKKEYSLLKFIEEGKISLEDTGFYSRNYDSSGRWNAMALNVKLYMNPNYIDNISNLENKKKLILYIEELIEPDRGYDVKEISFSIDISKEYSIDEDILEDLSEKSLHKSKSIIKDILPQDLINKGYYMAEIYTYLYCIENSIRMFIEKTGINKFGSEYFVKMTIPKRITEKIAERKVDEKSNKWISLRGDSELFYLDFIELSSILENNWETFREYFPKSDGQKWITSKLSDLYRVRNLIAHNSYVGIEEKNLLKSYYGIILKQIEVKEENSF